MRTKHPKVTAAAPAAPSPTDVTNEPAGTAPVKAETAPTAATPSPAAPAPVAAAPAAAPDPFASLDPTDRPIAEKIRDLLAAKTDKTFASKKEHASVQTFYQNRNLAPLWLEKGVESDPAKSGLAPLR